MILIPKGVYSFHIETNTHSITYYSKKQFTLSCDSLEGLLKLADEFFCMKPNHNSVIEFNKSYITSQDDTVWIVNAA